VKYLELGGNPNVFASFGGEARDRFEWFSRDAWTSGATDPNGYHLIRLMLHAEVRSETLRVYIEIKSNLAEGKSSPLRVTDEDRIDLHQAFLEWNSGPSGSALLRAGRQELNYGAARIITMRDGPNVRQSFDAVLGRYQFGSWKTDAFYGRPAETRDGSFDDRTNTGQLLYGIYAVKRDGFLGLNLDVYALGYERKRAHFDGLTGDETRYSVGSRLWGERGPFDFNFEGLWQWGKVGPLSIRAWTLASDTGVTLNKSKSLRASLKANVISGDRSSTDNQLNTFNALFPRGAYFGDISILGPANLINLHPGIEGKFKKRWSYRLDGVWFWRYSREDGVFGANGALLRSGRNKPERFIGTQANAIAGFQANSHWYLELQYARFWPGGFVETTGSHSEVGYVSELTRFRF
jgi:hypothetical protein